MPCSHAKTVGDKLNEHPHLKKYLLSCVAAGIAESSTFPFDLLKSRLQIQGEDTRFGPHRGLFGTAQGIVKNEGFFKLWSGLTPAVVRHFIFSGLRIVIYEEIRDRMVPHGEVREFSIGASLFAGVIAGSVAQFAASPTDLVKVKLQMEGGRVAAGLPRQYTGSFDVLRQVASAGVHKLWQGWIPNVQRAALIVSADFITYDGTKNALVRHTNFESGQFSTHLIASAASGLATALVSTPADVVKTRIMNQDHKNPIYRSSTHCLVTTVKNEGFLALYKGFVPIWLRLSPWVTIFWIVYERLRISTGSQPF